MRIRKRKVPLPFSLLSPAAPLSDPLLLLRRATSPVQLPPSDPPNPLHTNALEKEEREEFNDTRERSVFGAETNNGVLPQSSSSSQVVGRWCEREKTFPLKKRRGSCLERPKDEKDNELESMAKKAPEMKKAMKTKMNKKCTIMLAQNNLQEQESKPAGLDRVVVGKKRSRGGGLMEGSRCSRVNGRGWRCCQQTLVGYSLCEHHLGKGRLRSMNTVRSRSLPTAAAAATMSNIIVEEEGEKKPPPLSPPPPPPPPLTMAGKKRMKLGVVKARSISSLLGQTDSVLAAPPPSPPPPGDNDDK